MNIVENKGWPHCFSLADGTTLRILPHETVSVKASDVGDDLKIAANLGFISIYPEETKASPAVEKHMKANKEQEVQ